jgi:hypothetical protein
VLSYRGIVPNGMGEMTETIGEKLKYGMIKCVGKGASEIAMSYLKCEEQ